MLAFVQALFTLLCVKLSSWTSSFIWIARTSCWIEHQSFTLCKLLYHCTNCHFTICIHTVWLLTPTWNDECLQIYTELLTFDTTARACDRELAARHQKPYGRALTSESQSRCWQAETHITVRAPLHLSLVISMTCKHRMHLLSWK